MTELSEVAIKGVIWGSDDKLSFPSYHSPEPESTKVSSQRRNDPRLRNNRPWISPCRTHKSRMHAFIGNFDNNRFNTSRKHIVEHSRLVLFRKFVQGIMSLANLCKNVSNHGRGVRKTSQTKVMISNKEIPESDLYASFFIILSFFFLFVWVLPKKLEHNSENK